MLLPPELQFLSPLLNSPREEYKTAPWLLSDFDAPKWQYSFGYKKKPKELDWEITLSDGSSLLDSKNEELYLGFKYFLTTSTRRDFDLGTTNELEGQQAKQFGRACQIIDFLLINDKRYQLSTYGLAGLTGGNLIEMLETFSKTPSSAESVYNWTPTLREFCHSILADTSEMEIISVLKERPQLLIITNEQKDDDELGIRHELIPPIRAALYIRGLYGTTQVEYGRQPNTIRLSGILYPHVLWGKNQFKPVHSILGFNEDTSLFSREYPGVRTNTGALELMRDQTFFTYRSAVYSLGTLHEIGLPAPTSKALIEADCFTPELGTKGRFRTVPSDLVFTSLRNAIELHIEHGSEIIKGFCRIAIECQKRGVNPSTLSEAEVRHIVGPYLANLGVSRLSLSARIIATKTLRESIKGDKEEYFANLRSNTGLYDLLAVYVGGIQLTVGILMARRVSELYSLKADRCLDESGEWLLFGNGKSTKHLFGLRRREARPIEPIAADMIKSLIRMQKVLLKVGYIKSYKTLFALPQMSGTREFIDSSNTAYNRNLDRFCDYFETPVNDEGQRWYLRQHQMRRFFAMLFFYCGSFSNLDTLRWMLGHASLQHVYNYITESTDGALLNSVGAQFAAENIHVGNVENFTVLAEMLKDRYGTDNFGLIPSSELEDYINDKIKEGMVEIAPEFFTDANGEHMKVVARLKHGVAA
ncbi:integrase [Pseudomonas sp. SbB1]|uniref:Integrase family protein n=1 Tax=Pseudomonas putida (strain GB-1) TaxID=76869 RepID=B0KIY5_PSEPG|nr:MULTISPECIES: integrase [Pseudomonas]ABZ00675.1 integrase family protein [Pseudomonas putida GB-1]ANI32613.1 integrase [Pseudomonas sp. JY-Q]KPM66901.1 integrase [Pseudomonas putida]MBP0710929.1 integrase [Pseudomonas sp. T34]MCK2190376.1 integrase [Pseudomonas sp. MB04B]